MPFKAQGKWELFHTRANDGWFSCQNDYFVLRAVGVGGPEVGSRMRGLLDEYPGTNTPETFIC